MKHSFLILLLSFLFSHQLLAQDTIIKRNDSSANSVYKFQTHFGKYYYNNKSIKEKKMHLILNDTKDENIIRLVRNANISSWNKHIVYAAIPTGFACAVSLIIFKFKNDNYRNSSNQNFSHQLSTNEYNEWVTAICILAGATITFPIMSDIDRHNEYKYNKKAIKLYNEKY